MDPSVTVTPEMHPLFGGGILFFVVGLLVLELWGVYSKRKGDTITEGNKWVMFRLPPVGLWFYRIFGSGLLFWAILHLFFGAD